jgi:hypothetical protein
LVALSSERRPRLICARCNRPLPVKPGLPPYLWLQLNLRRWFVLLLLLVLPLLLLTLSSGQDQPGSRRDLPRLGRVTTRRLLQRQSPQQSAREQRRQMR